MSTVQDKTRPDQEDLTYGDIVWSQFRKNSLAYYSLWLLVGLFLLAIACPLIASDRPFIWTEAGETSYPWFSSLVDQNYFENSIDIFFNLLLVIGLPFFGIWMAYVKQVQKKKLNKRPRRRKMQRAGIGFIVAFFLLFAGVLSANHSEPYKQYYELHQQSTAGEIDTEISATFPPIPYGFRKTGFKSLEKPSSEHWLGVDQSTRDVAVRMLYGTRIALSIGVIAVSIYVAIGIVIGAVAGFFGGLVDLLIVRMIEIFMAVPRLIVILTLLAFIDNASIFHIMLVIGLLGWTGVARLIRGEFLRLRNLDFVTSAIALGFPTRRIIFQHLLPNALAPVLVSATFGVAAAILTESTLSFLGLGDVSVPSWGQTLSEGYSTFALHLIFAPGFAIFMTVSLLNLVGEGLRDALDPKMRK